MKGALSRWTILLLTVSIAGFLSVDYSIPVLVFAEEKGQVVGEK
jgi:hypothetical protein